MKRRILQTIGVIAWVCIVLCLVYKIDPTLVAPWHKGVFAVVAIVLGVADVSIGLLRGALPTAEKSSILNASQRNEYSRLFRRLDSRFTIVFWFAVLLKAALGVAAAVLFTEKLSAIAQQRLWLAGYVASALAILLSALCTIWAVAMKEWRRRYDLAETREAERRRELVALRAAPHNEGLAADEHLTGYTSQHNSQA